MLIIQNLRKFLVRTWEPVCSLVGMPSLVPSLPLSPPLPSPHLLPPVGDGSVHSLLPLLWNCSVPLFCEQPAVCSGQLIFLLSLVIPQFKLPSHVSSIQLLSVHLGPVLTLSNATRSSPFCPTCWWQMWVSGVLFCWELLLGL